MPERRAVTQEAVSQLKLLETCLSRIDDIVIVTEAEPIDEPGPRILYVNDAFVRRTGYTREEALRRTPRMLQGPNTDRVVLDEIHAAMQAWRPCRAELINYTKAGEEYWVELDVVPVADAQGWFTHWVAVERDITARRQAASAVEESERMAQATLDALPSPVCVLDETGRIQTTNLAWRAFTMSNAGNPQFTWEGANYLGVCQDFAHRHPDDEDAQLLVRELQRVLSGASDRFQLQYPCHSPTEARWFEARISRFPGSGPRRVVVVHLDVTGFKQAELREAMQARIMTLLANDAPLTAVLDAIVHGVEAENPTLIGAVLLFDAARGQFVHGAAPSLPTFYTDAVSGVAAWRNERVIVEDIASDPRWRDHAAVALRAGLRACGSEPVRDSAGKLLGSFAIYHRTPRAPTDSEFRLIAAAARFAAVAIERERDEAALQESEARFANAFEFAAVGVGLVGPDGHWLKVNRALCDMLGYSEAEMLGTHFNDITHPDDRDLGLELGRQLQSGARDSFQIEKRYLHRLGRVVWVQLSASQIRAANGQPLYEVCQVQDITAQKSAENERDTLFELSPDMLCVAYIDGRFKQVNPAWSRTLGWSATELLGMSYLELVHPADLEATLAAGQRLRAGHAVPDFENRYRCRDGGYRLLSWHSFPRPDVGVSFAVARDITEHAAAEAARRLADQRAGERQRMEALGSLAGGIAHDFNNNLAIMLGNVTLARHALAKDRPVIEKLAQIEIAGQRAVALVQQILAFSRRQPQQLRVQALGCIVTETLRLLRATIPAGIALDTHLEDDAPPILADETQLHQILMNLCTNAWHAIEALHGQGGVIEVRVDTCVHEEPGGARGELLADARDVCLTVRDNGIGMAESTRARLFEPFFTTREVGEGTGLGMSVVHGIVAAHHGTISVDSTPGLGTTVRVNFPAATLDVAAAAVAHDQPPTAATARRGAHVLYIDDEQQLVMLAREMLEEDGYTVTGLVDAAAALAAVRANPQAFDLVITDFNMPVLSGFDIVREIAMLRADLPVIVASGNITPAMQLEAGALGVRCLLQKPDIATRLRPLVREVLGDG